MDELIRNKIEYMIEKKPDKITELVKHWYKQDPEAVDRMLDYPEDAEHITNRKKYDELAEKIKWADANGRGAKWSFEDIKRHSKINFDNVDFTEYDYAYLVNMLYAKCSKYGITDANVYLKMARCLLEDKDGEIKTFQGHYAKNKQHKQYGAQSYYNEYDRYDEEDRRGRRRHYRNSMSEYNGDRFDNYDEESRRHYRNEYDGYPENSRYYKESNMGFNT